MNATTSIRISTVLLLGLVGVESAMAQRGGGGRGGGGMAMRGGGGMSHGSMGGGSMRSAPSVSRPVPSRPSSYTPSAPRSTPRSDYNRANISRSDFNRGDVSRPDVNRSNLPGGGRETSGTARSAYGSAANPPGYGSTLTTATPRNYGSVSRPAVAAGATAATLGGAALAANPNLGSRAAHSGTTRGGIDYGTATSARGGQAAAISGPRGDFAAIRGPGGKTVSGVRDEDGDRGAVRGPRGNTVVDNIPDECEAYYWGGHSYWHHDYYWYAPYWYNNAWAYEYRYPPAGYWYPALPPGYETVMVGDATYYTADAMYYQAGEKDGQAGYVVVPPPGTNRASQALAILQRTCDYLGSVTSFTAEVQLDLDRYLKAGDKVPVAATAVIRVRQPDRLAAEYKGSADDRKIVYDGKNVTVQDRREPKYSVMGAPPRLEDAISSVKAQENVILPFGDLLQRDAFDTLSTPIVSAEYVGVRKVGDVECHQLAFSQAGVDWQLWVQTGAKPLPMKALIQYKQEKQVPRYVWEVRKWELETQQPDDAFVIDQSPAPAPAPG